MKRSYQLVTAIVAVLALCGPTWSMNPILYSEDFDADSTVSWNNNTGVGFDVNVVGGPPYPSAPVDTNADFFFDYSSVGIPPAPKTMGGTTIGMKLQANLTSDTFGGFSVSPSGKSFVGDYVISFDAWSSSVGPFPFGGSGSTNMSSFGLLTSGAASNVPLNTDGVWFSYTGDGGSAADYRVYSVEQDVSYQLPAQDAIDLHATYHAGTRNSSGQLYIDSVGANRTVPQSVVDANPTADLSGPIIDGAAGFAWNQHEIKKVDDTIEWYVNGVLLITLDASEFIGATGGNNILFGHWDTNSASSTDPNKEELLFTLIDNVTVTALVPEPSSIVMLAGCLIAAGGVRRTR